MEEQQKLKVLIRPECRQDIRKKLNIRFGKDCEFIFEKDGKYENPLTAAQVMIGEPSEKELKQAETLRWLQLTWAGADKYTKMKGFPEGVTLTNASGAFGKIISEYVIGNIIALYRDFPRYWEKKKQHIWQQGNTASSIYGKKVLILGTGDIGTSIAHRLKAFETQVTGIRRNPSAEIPEDFDRICSIAELEERLPEGDIIIGCLPGTEETQGLFDYRKLKLMKKSAILVNVGRGSLIRTEDLCQVLKEGHLRGAVLDVFETEPLPEDTPLWEIERVILTPHIAGPSFGGDPETENRIWDICMENLERYLSGKKLNNIVRLKEGY